MDTAIGVGDERTRCVPADIGPTVAERLIGDAGARLTAWARRHRERRAVRMSIRQDRVRPLRILDPGTPEAVRRNGVPPGIIR